jgi:hypothetical protein
MGTCTTHPLAAYSFVAPAGCTNYLEALQHQYEHKLKHYCWQVHTRKGKEKEEIMLIGQSRSNEDANHSIGFFCSPS